MERAGGRFPLGTLAVNVAGSFLIGLLMTWMTERYAARPDLAAAAGGRLPGRLHHVLQLRMGDVPARCGRPPLAGAAQPRGGSVGLAYAAVWLGAAIAQEVRMLQQGAAKKVTIFVNEDTRHHGAPLYEAILSFLMAKGRLRRHRHPRHGGVRRAPRHPHAQDRSAQ